MLTLCLLCLQAFIQPLQPQVDAAAQPGGPYVDMQGQQLFPVPNPPPPPPLMEARRIPVPAAPQGAPIIITPPHPEGLLCLREQQARDGAAPVGRPRGPAVVTRMPSAEELAQLRREVEARNAPAPEPQLVQVRQHVLTRRFTLMLAGHGCQLAHFVCLQRALLLGV